jgi:hypothetical protein
VKTGARYFREITGFSDQQQEARAQANMKNSGLKSRSLGKVR